MTDEQAINTIAISINEFKEENSNIELFIGKETFKLFENMLQNILNIIHENKNDLNELNGLRINLIDKIKLESNSEKGILVLNPLCYEWMKNEVKVREPKLNKYFD